MTEQTTPRRRWLIGVLIVSLALNLLFIGFVLGAKLRGAPPPGAMLHNSAFSVGRAVRQFDEPQRSELWARARPHFKDLRQELRGLRGAQRRWEQAYRADPIDFAALDASHSDLTARVARIQQMNFAAIRSLAEALTPAERTALLSALRTRPHGPGHRRGIGAPPQAHSEAP